MQKTGIQYLTHTWNPIAMRCTPVSAGCDNCWHLRMANQMKANLILGLEKRASYTGGNPTLDCEELEKPLKLKKKSRIGVQLMGDLFHDNIPDYMIINVFNRCMLANNHQFLFLTKRPARMRQIILKYRQRVKDFYNNFWFGVSAENQETWDQRVSFLLNTEGINRWVSLEPLLGNIDFSKKLCTREACNDWGSGWGNHGCDNDTCPSRKIGWIACGAETGSGARLMKWEWAVNIANQCDDAGVPFFFKEPWHFKTPNSLRRREYPRGMIQ